MERHVTVARPVLFADVSIDDSFWEPRIRTNRENTIPGIYRHCKDTGRIDAFRLNWKPGSGPQPHVFWDSDVAKWIEAASYSLVTAPNKDLENLLDEVIELIASAQQPDGYLNIYYSVVEPGKRWTDLRDAHELYCAGHLIEAAVTHFQATGKTTLLDIMCRYADHIDEVFGRGEGQKRGYPGHPEIELALIRLYQATGESKYLDLSQYFVDERGTQPHYFDLEKEVRGGTPAYFEAYFNESGRQYTHEYNQSHKPVREQEKVVGHAVRAMYLFCAMADIAREVQDESLKQACERLWNHLTQRLLYVTGGIGSSDRNEGFTGDYDLPNETAYCETCASIGLVFWSQRMLQLDCNGRYADVMERALYNNIASGVGKNGLKFFYDNPLESRGNHHRKDWFDVSCCPPNVSRLFSSLGQYIYSQTDIEALVHLYIQSSVNLTVGEQNVKLRQESNYPWSGDITLHVDPEVTAQFVLKLRIPGWCRNARIHINGQITSFEEYKGYAIIDRIWKPGDVVSLELDMPVERVYAHPEVKADRGLVSLQRGPLVYCFEEVDNGKDLDALLLPRSAELNSVFEQDLCDGVVAIRTVAQRFDPKAWDGDLYRFTPADSSEIELKSVPYCTWDNRAAGEMRVWIREI